MKKGRNRKNICLDCFYYGVTRYGAFCNYDGSPDPFKTECPHFKSYDEAEKELLNRIETAKTIRTMIIKLSKLRPKIKSIEDHELRDELFELCFMADMLKMRLES